MQPVGSLESRCLRLTIGAKMITCRKNCFEQLILELHRITVHPRFCLPGLISGCNVMVSLSCARKGEPQGNLSTLHCPTGGSQRIFINFPDYITCILKAHRNLECNDFVPNGKAASDLVSIGAEFLGSGFGQQPRTSKFPIRLLFV